MKRRRDEDDGFYIIDGDEVIPAVGEGGEGDEDPAEIDHCDGCALCALGAKMVLLVTGLCNSKCFYCPLSDAKRGRDVVYANERPVDPADLSPILEEARLMDAEGTGITGGDPLCVPERTLEVIRMLKGEFGPDHHIHLYTATLDRTHIPALAEAGLDEIRFHPPPAFWAPERIDGYSPLRVALETDMQVGVEIPVIPDKAGETEALVKFLDTKGLHFVNLNELEFSETNAEALKERGYEVVDDVSAAVKGSEEAALELIRAMDEAGSQMPVHYCSSSYKDKVQLRERLRRRAANVIRPFEVLTDDDTLLFGIIRSDDPEAEGRAVAEKFEVPDDMWAPNAEKGRIEMAPQILERIAGDIERDCHLIEEYPTWDRLEVERRPVTGESAGGDDDDGAPDGDEAGEDDDGAPDGDEAGEDDDEAPEPNGGNEGG